MMKVILVNNNGKLKRRTSHGGKRSRQSLNPGNGDDRAGSGCTVAAAAEEEDSYRRSSLDNRLRKDAVAGTVDTREAEVEDILRDAAAPMDNQEADSEIGILLVRLFSNQILESIKDQRIES
ncbi:hypothetical protein DY000_02054823 [Brassica cretica]|uniref:Uncharacterized protein n=1 Tax=Brassica cretica TaxID=69181 RepID=A0ABQ7A4L3_BRACR|nr:hypothetical protein DY000_02054823 [Brassica cretica]